MPFASILDQHRQKLAPLVGNQDDLLKNFARFLNELWLANAHHNFVSRQMTQESLVTDHLIDCLIGLPYLPAAQKVADLGSGGGLPAAVLAITRPQWQVHCFEKSPVKCQFLSQLSLWLPNLVVRGPIPNSQYLGERFDWITARAFKPIPVTLELTRKHFLAGTPYYLYKARSAKISEELQKAKLNAKDFELIPLEPLMPDCERHLVHIERKS